MSKGSNLNTNIAAKLRQARMLLDECIAWLGPRPPRKSKQERHGAVAASHSPKSRPGHILKLRDGGYFKQSKTIADVQKKLNPTYECEFDRVAMALLRLQRRKKLRKASKKVGKRNLLAYVW